MEFEEMFKKFARIIEEMLENRRFCEGFSCDMRIPLIKINIIILPQSNRGDRNGRKVMAF